MVLATVLGSLDGDRLISDPALSHFMDTSGTPGADFRANPLVWILRYLEAEEEVRPEEGC